ncbi:MAG: enoyl-CoA hydratase/isomerase family protein [Opitutus sp.]
MDQEIIFTRKEKDGRSFAEITLNRPQKGNALTLPMLDAFESAVKTVAADSSLRALVLRGNGRFFCTGGDIEAWGSLSPDEMARGWILRGIEVIERLAALPQPVVAVITGHALGGGLELALAADLRIAVQSAKFGMPEVGLGMIAGWGGVRKLAETIGVARARHMTLVGSAIEARQALEWGLVTSLADDAASLEVQLQALLDRLLANAPLAMRETKAILATMNLDLRQQHAAAVATVAATADCQEGVRAFREKRRPTFHNR